MPDSPDLLRDLPQGVVTSEAPRSNLSASQIAQPFEMRGKALGQLGGALGDVAIPLAERAAASDLQNQKLVKDPTTGKYSVVNPAMSPILGDAGKAYSRAVQVGTAAQLDNTMRGDLQDIAAKHILDPKGYQGEAGSYLDKMGQQFGGTPAGQEAVRQAANISTAHSDAITMASAGNDVNMSRQATQDKIKDLEDQAIAYARTPNGTADPKYAKAISDLTGARQALADNPLFKTPQATIDLQNKQFAAQMWGEKVVTEADSIYTKKDKASAQAYLEQIRRNPNLDPHEADRLYHEGMSHLEYRTNEAAAGQKAIGESVDLISKEVASGRMKGTDPMIAQTLAEAEKVDPQSANRLRAIIQLHPSIAAVDKLPADQQKAVLGGAPPPSVDYKQRVSQIEGGGQANPPNSSTGAAGKYQFIPSTWAKYGAGGDIHGGQEAAMDRLTADNRAALQQGLGRAPTDSELYLAHQQGAAGARALLQNPDTPAGALVGNKAIAVNGGNPYAPAKDFVAMWAAKYNGTSYKPGASAPFTAAQGHANPHLYSEYFRSIAQDPEYRSSVINTAFETGSKAMDAGLPVDETTRGIAYQAMRDDPGKWAGKFEEFQGKDIAQKLMSAGGMGAGGGGAPMSTPEIKAAQQQLFEKARDAPDAITKMTALAASQYLAKQQEFKKDHPYEDANRRFGTPLPAPIDMQNPASIPDALNQRAALSAHIQQLDKSEAPPILAGIGSQIKNVLDNSPVAVKAQIYQAISQMPEEQRNMALKELGGNDPAHMAQAAAGSMMKDRPEMGTSILNGLEAMKNPDLKRFDPETEDGNKRAYYGDLDKVLPTSVFPQSSLNDPSGPYATTAAMVKARFVDTAVRAGDSGYTTAKLQAAVNDVTGGILSHNGGSLIAPVPGMEPPTFDRVLKGITDQDLQGVQTIGGTPVTADYLRQSARLESIHQDGKYLVRVGGFSPGAPPVYAYQNGSRFVLDLNGKTPVAATGIPTMDAVSAFGFGGN